MGTPGTIYIHMQVRPHAPFPRERAIGSGRSVGVRGVQLTPSVAVALQGEDAEDRGMELIKAVHQRRAEVLKSKPERGQGGGSGGGRSSRGPNPPRRSDGGGGGSYSSF